MPKKYAHLTIFLLPFALAACNKPVEGAAQAEPSNAMPAAESAAVPAVVGKAFDEAKVALIQGGAKLQASAVACELGTRAQADQGTAELRAKYVEEGYDGGAFDRLHDAAFEETLGKFGSASAQQKAQACAQMKQLGDQMGEMAKGVQKHMESGH